MFYYKIVINNILNFFDIVLAFLNLIFLFSWTKNIVFESCIVIERFIEEFICYHHIFIIIGEFIGLIRYLPYFFIEKFINLQYLPIGKCGSRFWNSFYFNILFYLPFSHKLSINPYLFLPSIIDLNASEENLS